MKKTKSKNQKLPLAMKLFECTEAAPKRFFITCMVGGWCSGLSSEVYIEAETQLKAAKEAVEDGWTYGIVGDSEGPICPNCKNHLKSNPEDGYELKLLYPEKSDDTTTSRS